MAKDNNVRIKIDTNVDSVIKKLHDLQKIYKGLDVSLGPKPDELRTIQNYVNKYKEQVEAVKTLKSEYASIKNIMAALKATGAEETKIGQKRLQQLQAQADAVAGILKKKDASFETDEEKSVKAAAAARKEQGDKISSAARGMFGSKGGKDTAAGNIISMWSKQKFDSGKMSAKGYAAAQIIVAVMNKIVADVKKIAATVNNILKDTIGTSLSFKDIMNDAIKRIGTELNPEEGMGSFATTSIFTNAAAREQRMRYGISEAQNYALTRVMSTLGMRSEEDLMYMNVQQRAMFEKLMVKYENWYEEMNRNGVLEEVQQFQLEFSLFKQKLAMEFLQWFAKNKDAVFNTIKTIANFMLQLANGVTKLVTAFGRDKSTDEANTIGVGVMSDRLTYTNGSQGKIINITVTQSNNVSGITTDDIEEILNRNNEQMAKEINLALGD